MTLKPDIIVYDNAGAVRLVADAKWKTTKPTNADFYQLTSYMLANDAPGVLVYPDCNGETASESEVAGKFPLSLIELPTASSRVSHEEYIHEIEDTLSEELTRTLGQPS